jgi:hypothetical protein
MLLGPRFQVFGQTLNDDIVIVPRNQGSLGRFRSLAEGALHCLTT